jgi:ABC-type xylose transport system permease subunit
MAQIRTDSSRLPSSSFLIATPSQVFSPQSCHYQLVLGVLYVILSSVLTRSRSGRHVYAIAGNPEASGRA